MPRNGPGHESRKLSPSQDAKRRMPSVRLRLLFSQFFFLLSLVASCAQHTHTLSLSLRRNLLRALHTRYIIAIEELPLRVPHIYRWSARR